MFRDKLPGISVGYVFFPVLKGLTTGEVFYALYIATTHAHGKTCTRSDAPVAYIYIYVLPYKVRVDKHV